MKSAGCDPEELFGAARSQEIKDKLRENTERFVYHMFWGMHVLCRSSSQETLCYFVRSY